MSLVLGVIPARAGSKRLPGKNKKLFHGMPLWWWSVACAQACDNLTDYVVTTDDDDIQNVCRRSEIPFIQRWPHLCTDDASARDVCIDAVLRWLVNNPEYQERLSFSGIWVVLLQPTSPIRNFTRVNRAISEVTKSQFHKASASSSDEESSDGGFYCVNFRHLLLHGFDAYGVFRGPMHNNHVDIDTQEDWDAAIKEPW